MEKKKATKILDQLENSCRRAEEGKKDLDLLVALRALHALYEEVVRHGEETLPRK